MASASYAEIPHPSSTDEIDSLPSSSAGSSTSSSPSEDEAYSDAEREWKESLQQLELMLTLVLIPYLGKYFGRKCAYWGEFGRVKLVGSTDLKKRRGLMIKQAGPSSWNGNIRFPSRSLVRLLSRAPV